MTLTNWKIKTISSLCEKIYSGGTPNTKKREYWNGDLKWLSSGETRNKFIFNTEKRITELGAKKSSTRLAHSGDVVMASAGQGYTRGQVSLLKTDTYINQSVIVFKSNSNELLSEYLFYNLSNRYEELRALSDSNSIRGSITTKLFNSIEMIIPPLNIQKQIVETLRSLDEKIENNKKINHHLEQMAQAIFKSWFVDFEPFGGVMPDDWREGTLGDIIELFDFKRVPLSGNQREKMAKVYPYYGAATLMDYVDDYLFDGIYLLLGEDGTVIDDLGFPTLQYVWGKFWVNNHAHILQGRNGFTVESLYVLMKQTSVTSIVTGAVQPKINQANLKALGVLIPSAEVMEQFNALIDPLFAKIRANHDENLHLTEIRDVLLPKLMSGELSVADLGDAK